MPKDPAMLWYWNDWHSGTILFSRFLKGCYIDLLHAQFNNGRLSLEEIKICLGSDFGSSWPTLQKKFKQDESGLFFSERLEREKEKREAFTEGRRRNLAKNAHVEKHMEAHMETHMDNRNRDCISGTLAKEEYLDSKRAEIKEFLTNQRWKEEFCMVKRIEMHELEQLQEEWLKDIALKEEWVDNYKKYFTNYYNKNLPKAKGMPATKRDKSRDEW